MTGWGCDAPERHVFSGYKAGYHKAIVDLRSFLEERSDCFSSSKLLPKNKNMLLQNLLSTILADLDEWMRMGGAVDMRYDPASKHFTIIKE